MKMEVSNEYLVGNWTVSMSCWLQGKNLFNVSQRRE
jgi:hypothetical protein